MIDDDANPSETPEIPEPAETDPVSPYTCLNSKKLHDAAIRALDYYLSPPPQNQKLADRRPSSIFIIAPPTSTKKASWPTAAKPSLQPT